MPFRACIFCLKISKQSLIGTEIMWTNQAKPTEELLNEILTALYWQEQRSSHFSPELKIFLMQIFGLTERVLDQHYALLSRQINATRHY
jgi:hypothetical protein